MTAEINKQRYKKALYRNLNEAGMAILERRAMVGLEKARTHHTMDFIRITYNAMFNDMIAHAMKLFEDSDRVASFWYVNRCRENEVKDFAEKNKIDTKKLYKMKEALKHVRDKTHFHIDRDAVKDPAVIWDKAGIKGRDLAQAIDIVFQILDHLYILETGDSFPLPKYSGADATKIAKYAAALEE
jgi:hypothetical protein